MAFTEIDEKLLVKAHQAGDERAFDTIVRTQYQALYAHALRRLTSHESAEDAVQDTLLRAYRALPNLDGDLALRAWLHRILTNVCHDEGSRRRRQAGLLEKQLAQPEEVVEDIAEEGILFETVQTMAKALEDIPERYREALVLRYVDGLSFREVAEATGTTEENARARVHRGRQTLRKLLSRVAVLAAFVIPGLKRTQAVAPPGAEQAATAPGLSEQGVTLVTQLTTHAVQAAPAVSRLAELSAALPGGKSTLATAAVAAVAAAAVPVAYTVNEVRKPEPARPPAQVAAATTVPPRLDDPIVIDNGTSTSTTTVAVPQTTTTTTSTTLPPSQAEPFAGTAVAISRRGVEVTTTTAAPSPTTTTTVVAPAPAVVLEGSLAGSSFEVTRRGPQFDLSGAVRLTVDKKTTAGKLAGLLAIYEDGTASADELDLTLDGRTLDLRLRANEVVEDGETYRFTAQYSLPGAEQLGLAAYGEAAVVFRFVEGGASTLTVQLRGEAGS